MKVPPEKKTNTAAATRGGRGRHLSGIVLLGCACLLGGRLLVFQPDGDGQALTRAASFQAGLGPSPNSTRAAMSPSGNPPGGSGGPATAASRQSPFRRNFTARLAEIRAVPDPAAREELLDRLAESIAIDDIAKALAFLGDRETSELTAPLSVQLLRRWTEASPAAAAAWVGARASGASRQDEIAAVALVWADHALPEALAWVRALPDAAERNTGLIALAYEAARSAPMEAFRMAEALPDGGAKDDLIRHTARQWAVQDPQQAIKWASQVEDESFRQRLLVGIITAWADQEPAAAASAAANLLPPGRPQDDAVVGIVQRWAQSEPEQAAAWVADFPSGTLRDTAVEAVVKLRTDQAPAPTGE
jgi:hypothetical protein